MTLVVNGRGCILPLGQLKKFDEQREEDKPVAIMFTYDCVVLSKISHRERKNNLSTEMILYTPKLFPFRFELH